MVRRAQCRPLARHAAMGPTHARENGLHCGGLFPAHTLGRAAGKAPHDSESPWCPKPNHLGARTSAVLADRRTPVQAHEHAAVGARALLSCCPGYRQRSSSRYHPSVVATMRFTRAPCPPPLWRQPRVRTFAHEVRRVHRQAGRRRAAGGVSDACRGRGPCTVECARAPPGREQGTLRGGPPASSKMCEHMGGHAVHLDTFFFFLVTFFFSAGVCALSVATYAGWNRA